MGRNAAEAKRMLEAVEKAGIFNGYLEDLVYTPKFLKAFESVKNGALAEYFGPNQEKHIPVRIAIGSGILNKQVVVVFLILVVIV